MTDLTDLEATRLCLRAIGLQEAPDAEPVHYWQPMGGGSTLRRYDPLHDRAQWAELVEKLHLNVKWIQDVAHVIGWYEGRTGALFEEASSTTLAHAVVHCVARIQLSRERGGKKP